MFPRLKLVMIAIALIGFVIPATHGIAKAYSIVIQQERTVEPGSGVVVRNAFGDIRVAGSDRDTVEAIATDTNGSQAVPVTISEGSSGNQRVFTVSPVEGGRSARQQINLEIKVPRDVELEAIGIHKGNIRVMDLNGGVRLRTDEGHITVSRVGSPAGGLVEVTAPNGNVDLSNINGDVRIVAISSNITVQCVKGDVAARVASGHIEVSNSDGDVELNVSSGSASFTGAIHSEGRYRLQTLSGDVSMNIPDTVGFTAVLSAYSGRIDRDFQFSHALRTAPPGRTNHRLIGMYGDGRGRIELDSFSGNVSLRKIVASSGADCQR
jgi:putative adhesin